MQSDSSISRDSSRSSLSKKSKLFDKTKRAFSISIESSKAFELAIRKPRNQCKHYFTRFRAFLYGLFLMFVRQTGSHPNVKDLTPWFVTYSAVMSLDFLMLINYSLHVFIPATNFQRFGWAFVVWVTGAPYIAPILGFCAAFQGDVRMMQVASKFHSYTIVFNIPLSAVISYFARDDPVFFLELAAMVLIKMALSATSSKIRQYLLNPRFASNNIKLMKIMTKQGEKIQKRQEILGKQTLQQLNASTETSMDMDRNDSLEVQEKLRDKLLE